MRSLCVLTFPPCFLISFWAKTRLSGELLLCCCSLNTNDCLFAKPVQKVIQKDIRVVRIIASDLLYCRVEVVLVRELKLTRHRD